jgi:hypothetical protein
MGGMRSKADGKVNFVIRDASKAAAMLMVFSGLAGCELSIVPSSDFISRLHLLLHTTLLLLDGSIPSIA